jgi:hypothetical protein
MTCSVVSWTLTPIQPTFHSDGAMLARCLLRRLDHPTVP